MFIVKERNTERVMDAQTYESYEWLLRQALYAAILVRIYVPGLCFYCTFVYGYVIELCFYCTFVCGLLATSDEGFPAIPI